MPDYLLDTNILIRHFRRHQPTTDLMAALILDGEVGVAAVTRIEMIQGMREHERAKTLELLNSFISLGEELSEIQIDSKPKLMQSTFFSPQTFSAYWQKKVHLQNNAKMRIRDATHHAS